MNACVDLMPMACRAALQRRARVRMWVGAYASTAAVLISLYAAFTAGRQAQVRELTELNNQVELNWSRNHEVQELMTELESLELDIKRYNRLAWPLQVSSVLQCVAGIVPREATLTSVAVIPKSERSRRARQGSDTAPLLGVEVEGVAKHDSAIAAFVKSLESQQLFNAVSLDFARPADVDGIEARRFRVTATIALDKNYKFLDVQTRASAGLEASP